MRCPACGHENLPGMDECGSCLESLMQEDVPRPDTPLEATIMGDPIAALNPPVPEIVATGTPLRAALAHMQATNIGYVLVVDRDRKLVGIFTERDVIDKVVGQEVDLELPVDSLMTHNPTALRPSTPINQALHLMAIEPGFRYIPLVDDANRPIALISFRRLLRRIAQVEAAS